jgi:antitoxin MazE
MIISVVQIGNSKGIRIPKYVLEELNIQDAVDLRITDDHLVVSPIKKKPRSGWDEAFRTMHDQGDDKQLLPGDTETGEHDGFKWDM